MENYKFHVHGMHCKSCAVLIEHNLGSAEGISGVKVNEKDHTVELDSSKGLEVSELANYLTGFVSADGYRFELERQEHRADWKEFYIALPVAIAIMSLFVAMQKLGLINLINAAKITYPVAFGIGMVASVSSCLAVVGGLLLSVAANYAKTGERSKPQIYFHLGRLVSFFVLGGVIGAIGSAFTLNNGTTATLNAFIGVVMLILGINLLDVFPWAKRFQIGMPKFLSKSASQVSALKTGLAPMLIGLSTFFLPCGFTQAMQIYSLSTGSFMAGAMTMFAFALGTLPVLGLISFSSVRLGRGKWSSVFFKTTGLLVIAFAAINILGALAVAGIIKPVLNF